MGLRRRRPAEVIDISPLVCAGCNSYVSEEDDFCRRCGHNLAGPVPTAPPQASQVPERKKSRWRVAILATVLLLVCGSAGYAAWMNFVRPSVGTFDGDVTAAAGIAEDVQRTQDALRNPSGLPAFADDVEAAIGELGDIAASARGIESDKHRLAASAVVDALDAYLDELARLAALPSAAINDSQYGRAHELADELAAAIAEAAALRDLDTIAGFEATPSSLERVLANLADYRRDVLRQRARIIRANQARTARLSKVRAFTQQLDGVIARYSAARSELSDWIVGVDTYGATFTEAYQVLGEHAERRRQLRSELAALPAPAELASAKGSLLGVMDRAVAAMEAAYRGIEEYQWDFTYMFYDETPGWREFESQTDSISDDYASVLQTYSAQKERVIARLSRKTPLPKVPA